MTFRSFFSFALLLLSSTQCVYRHLDPYPIPPCSNDKLVSFAETIQPIIQAKCAVSGCHNGSSSSLTTLNTFAQVSPNASDILTQLSNKAMPPKNMPQLRPDQLAYLNCWISQGGTTP